MPRWKFAAYLIVVIILISIIVLVIVSEAVSAWARNRMSKFR